MLFCYNVLINNGVSQAKPGKQNDKLWVVLTQRTVCLNRAVEENGTAHCDGYWREPKISMDVAVTAARERIYIYSMDAWGLQELGLDIQSIQLLALDTWILNFYWHLWQAKALQGCSPTLFAIDSSSYNDLSSYLISFKFSWSAIYY